MSKVKLFVGGLTLEPLEADPSSPVEGQLQYADGTARTEGVWVYKNGAWEQVGSGGTGLYNYITNPDAEVDTSDWSTYADAAATTPVDGTGGSANITWTRNTSSPLGDGTDFLLTKDAANRQGQGVSTSLTTFLKDRSSVKRMSCKYTTSANYVDGDVRFYIYDVTNSRLIEPDRTELYARATAGNGHLCSFQLSADSESYRFIIHVASTNASTYTIQFTDFFIGDVEVARSLVATDAADYTPTFTGFGTVNTHDIQYSRIGDKVIIQGEFTSGTPTATEARVSLPFSVSASSKYGSNIPVGRWFRNQSSANSTKSGEIIVSGGQAYFKFNTNHHVEAIDPSVARNGDAITIAGEVVSFFAEISVEGWSSGQVVSEDYGQRTVASRMYRSAAQNIAVSTVTKVAFDTKSYDKTNSCDVVTNNRFTVPESGLYHIESVIGLQSFTTAEVGEIYIYVNGSARSRGFTSSATTIAKLYVCDTLDLVKGDYVEIFVDSQADTNYDLLVGQYESWVSIFKLSSNQQIAASEIVAARYDSNAGQVINSGVTTRLDAEDKTYDTHNAVTTGASWVFTAPVSGIYSASATTQYDTNSAFNALNEYHQIRLNKNGVLVTVSIRYAANTTGEYYPFLYFQDEISLLKGDTLSFDVVQTSNSNLTSQGVSIRIHKIGGIA